MGRQLDMTPNLRKISGYKATGHGSKVLTTALQKVWVLQTTSWLLSRSSMKTWMEDSQSFVVAVNYRMTYA
jgi:hypothetical protein